MPFESFEEWMERVNQISLSKFGQECRFFPDLDWRGWYDQGMPAWEAFDHAVYEWSKDWEISLTWLVEFMGTEEFLQ
jgi:hypothetical protein